MTLCFYFWHFDIDWRHYFDYIFDVEDVDTNSTAYFNLVMLLGDYKCVVFTAT